MGFLDDFTDCMTQTVVVSEQSSIGNPIDGESDWAAKESILNCAFYEGASANQFVSDKFKAKTDGVIVINPSNLVRPILDSYRLSVNSRNFNVVHADDVMLLGEVLAVAVEEDKHD